MTTLMERPRVAAPRHQAPPSKKVRRWPVLVLLAATAVLYLWDLSASGWGNSFYAAAAQAGAQSWKAWLFGSLDAGNAITVDKPPAAMWVMGLSARLFGVNSWSILAPQAVIGVASVYLLYLTVQRWFGRNAALLAGAALALTPVAVLMFRYDNPDALLTLLLTAGGYATTRAVEKASWKWLALTGVLLGLGFLTKMMQAFLVLPAFALVYLVAAPTGLGRRIRDLLIAGLALIVSAGWYIALVSLWPASSRPYIAGSTNNTLWELALGYNGLGRIFGGDGNGGGGGNSGNVGFGGAAGIGRLFGQSMGTEISWLLPAALIAMVAVLAITFTAPRTDRARAAILMWGGWLLVTGVTFSYMSGTIHPYYTVALAPAIAGLVAVGGRVLWLCRSRPWARALLAAMVLATAVWGAVLMGRADWLPVLRWASLALGVLTAVVLLAPTTRLRRFAVVALVAAILSAGASGAAYAASTASVAHTGSIPSSGPSSEFGGTRGGAANRMGGAGTFGSPSGSAPGSAGSSETGSSSSSSRAGVAGSTGPGSSPGGPANAELTALLKASTTKWSAAISGATSAAELELDSGTSVIALGGWNGSDPSPTLAEFQAYVRAGQIHYYIAGGGMGGGGMGGSSTDSSQIAAWVAANYKSTTVGSTTVYDLTQAATG
ncbi:glycosyltransferase family 39 protein [Actinoplanes sp. KI2]|uniref:glycosyltransferase family 39 protein n=1 Tax=Actinoplanes sp. KI2 TaxID=2983315 RepID=UPI0021D5E1F1|nr:glycosyltransferase family 39 protein [Actinoplanes sp. KI2]MCU7728684.1 glycosyltransferase family 39 protein [Actinoplanes sp. KI2]